MQNALQLDNSLFSFLGFYWNAMHRGKEAETSDVVVNMFLTCEKNNYVLFDFGSTCLYANAKLYVLLLFPCMEINLMC